MVEVPALPNKIVFLVGIDGVGKTTYTKMILKALQEKGINAKHGWSRNSNYFSKPLLAFAIITGLSIKKYHQGITFQYYDFWRSIIVSKLYIWLQVVDVNIATYFKIYKKAKKAEILICDRGPYDTLVDIMLGTGANLLDKNRSQKFIRLLPKEHKVIYLYRPINEIVRDRPELRYDKSLHRKNELYLRMQKEFNWKIIENVNPPNHVFNEILTFLYENKKTPRICN